MRYGRLRRTPHRIRRHSDARKSLSLLSGQPDRDTGRRASGRRSTRGARLAVADHVHTDPGRRDGDARLYFLRRDVWRLDDLDPAQHSGRGRVRRDLPRRAPDGEAGTRRPGARHRGDRLLRRGHARRYRDDVLRASDRGGGHSLRTPRELCPDGAGRYLHALYDRRLVSEGRADGGARISHRSDRHRRGQRAGALHLRLGRPLRRHRVVGCRDRTVRRDRSSEQRREDRQKHRRDRPHPRPMADTRGLARIVAANASRQRAWIRPRPGPRRRAGHRVVHVLRLGEAHIRSSRAIWKRRHRRRCRPGIGQQRRRRWQHHPGPVTRHPGQSGDRVAARRPGDPGHPARPTVYHPTSRPVLGDRGQHVRRQRVPAAAESSVGRAVGPALAYSLSRAVSNRAPALRGGHLFGEQERLRPVGHARVWARWAICSTSWRTTLRHSSSLWCLRRCSSNPCVNRWRCRPTAL